MVAVFYADADHYDAALDLLATGEDIFSSEHHYVPLRLVAMPSSVVCEPNPPHATGSAWGDLAGPAHGGRGSEPSSALSRPVSRPESTSSRPGGPRDGS